MDCLWVVLPVLFLAAAVLRRITVALLFFLGMEYLWSAV